MDTNLTPDIEDSTIITTDSKVKVKLPNIYYGEREKLEDWLIQVNLYFCFGPDIKETNKAVYATSFLRGKALR